MGTGRSKKEAKHGAAKNVLDKIVGNNVKEEDEAVVNTSSTGVVTDKTAGNPIGSLQV